MSDLISRQDAIDYLMTNMAWYNEDGYEESEDEKLSAITDLINGVPSAQPERKKGNWNTHDVVKILVSGKVLDGFMQCTVCGCIFDDHSTEYYYCPNCGADMRGEQDEISD